MCEECANLRWRLDALVDQVGLLEERDVEHLKKIRFLKNLVKEKEASDPGEDVRALFDFWVAACHKDPERTKLNLLRRKAIRGAFAEGYSMDDLRAAIEGIALDPFINPKGKVMNDIGVAMRKVEHWRDVGETAKERLMNPPPAPPEAQAEAKKELMRWTGRQYMEWDKPALWSGGFEYFASLLNRAGRRFYSHDNGSIMAQCPAHDDHNPSLHVTEADDGRVLATCHSAGCSWEAICAALGVPSSSFGPRYHPTYGTPLVDGREALNG